MATCLCRRRAAPPPPPGMAWFSAEAAWSDFRKCRNRPNLLRHPFCATLSCPSLVLAVSATPCTRRCPPLPSVHRETLMSPTMSDLAASLAIAAAMLLSGVARAQAPAPRGHAQALGGLTESAPVQTLSRPIEQGPQLLFSVGGSSL